MANVMTMKKLQNKTSRNGFDLSRKNIYTAKLGELLPVACIECIPGDSFNIKTQHFTRTRPVNTAAYTRIREYYDWFFVPTNLLWNKFNTFVTQMGKNNQQAESINAASSTGDHHPFLSRQEILNYLYNQHTQGGSGTRLNLFGYQRLNCSCKLLEYLDYGHWFDALGNPINPETFEDDVALNPFPILAYQKIYSDYFRNSQWEDAYAPAFNINYMSGGTRPEMKIPLNSMSIYSAPYNMFDLHYCNWHKDYFMGLLPNSQYGDAASVNISSLISNFTGTAQNGELYISNRAESPAGNVSVDGSKYLVSPAGGSWALSSDAIRTISDSIGLSSGSLIGAFSILALRNAEAMQKWAEITQSQQQDYQSQVDAHFGVKVSDAYSERCTWIGGDDSTINIDEVVNNNITAANDAAIAGKGTGAGEGFSKFETKVHGYLMCIYHAVPLLEYSLSGIPKQNLKTTVTDYAIPEFDKTGMVSVPLQELYSKVSDEDTYDDNLPDLLGYAPRYYDYKTSFDRIHGGFNFANAFGAWVAPVSSEYLVRQMLNSGGNQGSINYGFFKVNPAFLNPIFDMDADDTLSSDQFLINSYFDIKAVRNLDRDGLPY